MLKTAIVSSLTCLLIAGCAAAAPTRTNLQSAEAPPPRLHRLEYTLIVDDGATKVRRTYALGLEERRGGEIRSGANVSLSSVPGAAGPRVDTGVTLRSKYAMIGDALALHVDFESSQSDAARSIQKVSAKSDALITTGAATELLRAHDPTGNVDYTLVVTATKLR